MRVIYCQHQNEEAQCKNLILSGYTCPFNNLDCLHLDSLSMTKTIDCNHCECFIHGKKTDNSENISIWISELH